MDKEREIGVLTLTTRQAAQFYLMVHAPAATPEALGALEALFDNLARKGRAYGQRETAVMGPPGNDVGLRDLNV